MAHGGRRPGAGRKPGGRNQKTKDGEALAQQLVTDAAYQDSLKRRLADGTAPHMETLLWQLAYGKPVERKVVTGNPDEPLVVKVVEFSDDA